jgi:hypothetical protein
MANFTPIGCGRRSSHRSRGGPADAPQRSRGRHQRHLCGVSQREESRTVEARTTLLKSDAQVNFAPFKSWLTTRDQGLRSALHARWERAQHIEVETSTARSRSYVGGDLQRPPVSSPKDLCAFSDDVEIGQYAAAIREELLAFAVRTRPLPTWSNSLRPNSC